jgi:hypothetical protein
MLELACACRGLVAGMELRPWQQTRRGRVGRKSAALHHRRFDADEPHAARRDAMLCSSTAERASTRLRHVYTGKVLVSDLLWRLGSIGARELALLAAVHQCRGSRAAGQQAAGLGPVVLCCAGCIRCLLRCFAACWTAPSAASRYVPAPCCAWDWTEYSQPQGLYEPGCSERCPLRSPAWGYIIRPHSDARLAAGAVTKTATWPAAPTSRCTYTVLQVGAYGRD